MVPNQKPSPEVLILTPFAHRPGHHEPIALGLSEALRNAHSTVSVFSTYPPSPSTAAQASRPWLPASFFCRNLLSWFSQLRLPRFPSRFIDSLEVLAVFLQALPRALDSTPKVFHLIDSTFTLATCWVFWNRHPTVYYLSAVPQRPNFRKRPLHWLSLQALRLATRTGRLHFVCETPHVYHELQAEFFGHASLIPYAVSQPEALMPQAQARAALDLPADQFILLLFGTQRTGKDYQTVFTASQLLPFPVYLLFAGALISDNDPKQIGQSLGYLSARYDQHSITEEQIPAYFAAADAAILPYAPPWLHGSGVLMESCRFGRPLIVTDTGHLRTWVEQHKCGFWYTADSPSALAEAILKLSKASSEERSRIGANASLAVGSCSWPELVSRYQLLYQNLSQGTAPQN